jgi:hypothetical protein
MQDRDPKAPQNEPIDYDAELGNLFAYHRPLTPEVAQLHEKIRDQMNYTAQLLNSWLPASHEKSLALTKVQEAMWAANAAVAIHQPKPEENQ